MQAPTSDVPTLIFEGAFDPVLPPTLGDVIAKTLTPLDDRGDPGRQPRQRDGTPCASSITGAFLDDPSAPLDTSCVASLPPPFAP